MFSALFVVFFKIEIGNGNSNGPISTSDFENNPLEIKEIQMGSRVL